MGDFEAFYRRHVRTVHTLALSRTTGEAQAEDLTQDAFLRAWQHYGELEGADDATQRAWLARTVRNLAIDAWRRRMLAPTESLGTLDLALEERAEPELRLDLGEALAALEARDREIVMLRYVEEMNSREIAQITGLPEGTVRRRLLHCRRLLARRLPQWAPQGGAR